MFFTFSIFRMHKIAGFLFYLLKCVESIKNYEFRLFLELICLIFIRLGFSMLNCLKNSLFQPIRIEIKDRIRIANYKDKTK